MTISEATKAGHRRVRRKMWASPNDYLLLHLQDGMRGPWAKLYSPTNVFLRQANPQILPLIGDTDTDWEPCTGPLDPDEENSTR